MVTHHRYAEIAGRQIFYREGGSPALPERDPPTGSEAEIILSPGRP